MGRIQVGVVIKAPVSNVWNYYTDIDKLQEWIPGGNIVKFEWLSPPPKSVGSRFRVSVRVAGRVSTWIAEMTEMVENKKSAYKLVEGDLKLYEDSFEFEPVNEETKVTDRINYELPYSLLGKLLDILTVENSIRSDMQAMLERLKTNVEKLEYHRIKLAS
jgi:ligand-binding SRPBCC domain-containing protein